MLEHIVKPNDNRRDDEWVVVRHHNILLNFVQTFHRIEIDIDEDKYDNNHILLHKNMKIDDAMIRPYHHQFAEFFHNIVVGLLLQGDSPIEETNNLIGTIDAFCVQLTIFIFVNMAIFIY